MRQVITIMVAISAISIFIVGCSKSGNPVGPSDTQSSGSLQYTFSTPNTTYKSGDTLTAAITVHNSGSVADTIGVEASLFQWALVNSSGDSVMKGGNGYILAESLSVAPGQTERIDFYSIKQVLREVSGQGLPSGSYSLEASVGAMSFILKLSVQ